MILWHNVIRNNESFEEDNKSSELKKSKKSHYGVL
jgi:hypothetical protein